MSVPGNTPRRRSADTTMNSRRKLSASKEASKEAKMSVDELNKKNSSSTSSITGDKISKVTPKTTKPDTPSVENDTPSINSSVEAIRFTDRTSRRSPSPLAQERTVSKSSSSMTRQEAVSDIKRTRALLNGEAKMNGDDKIITTAKPPLVAAKEPVVTSKPPTAKPHDSSRDNKSNSVKNTSKDNHPAVTDIKDAAKEQSHSGPSRRISQFRLTGNEALHIFHPTRRSTTPKSGEYSDSTSEQTEDDSRTNSPTPLSKSPVPDKKPSSLKQDSRLSMTVEETKMQQQPPPPPKSPVTSVTGTRRPGVVESKQKKMLALLGQEASVDMDRPTDIQRTTPVSISILISK